MPCGQFSVSQKLKHKRNHNLINMQAWSSFRIIRPVTATQKAAAECQSFYQQPESLLPSVYQSSFGKPGPDPRLTSSVITANVTVQCSEFVNGILISEIHQIAIGLPIKDRCFLGILKQKKKLGFRIQIFMPGLPEVVTTLN